MQSGESAKKLSALLTSDPAPEDPRRFEVRVEHDSRGRRIVVLEDLSWGNGVGWYVQKTIRLDAQQIDALLGALCVAKQGADKETSSGCPAGSGCGAKIHQGIESSDLAAKIVQLEPFLRS